MTIALPRGQSQCNLYGNAGEDNAMHVGLGHFGRSAEYQSELLILNTGCIHMAIYWCFTHLEYTSKNVSILQ